MALRYVSANVCQRLVTCTTIAMRNFSAIRVPVDSSVTRSILEARVPQIQQVAGYKFKPQLKRRCRFCRYVRMEDPKYGWRMHIVCDAKPRHNQIKEVPEQRWERYWPFVKRPWFNL